MQLLKITNQQARIKIDAQNAQLQIQQKSAEISRKTIRGGLKLRSRNIQVKIDTYAARKSLGLMKVGDAIKEAAAKGLEATNEAVKEYAEMGNRMANAHKGVSVADAASQKFAPDFTTQMVFLPSVGAQLSWESEQLDMDYTADENSVSWDTGGPKMDYVPGQIKIEMEQYPNVKIEYTGRPNYVPPSADPLFEKDE